MMLGSLLKSAALSGFWPPPIKPYQDVVFSVLAKQMRELKVTALCDSISKVQINGAWPKPAHGLQVLIDEKINELEARLCGLDLKDFVEKKVDS